MHESNRKSLTNNALGDSNLNQTQTEDRKDIGILTALKNYKSDHTEINLQKLCNEVLSFCKAIYASTTNDKERKVYNNMVERLQK